MFFLDSILPLTILGGDDVYKLYQVDETCSVRDCRKEEEGNKRLIVADPYGTIRLGVRSYFFLLL